VVVRVGAAAEVPEEAEVTPAAVVGAAEAEVGKGREVVAAEVILAVAVAAAEVPVVATRVEAVVTRVEAVVVVEAGVVVVFIRGLAEVVVEVQVAVAGRAAADREDDRAVAGIGSRPGPASATALVGTSPSFHRPYQPPAPQSIRRVN
jgi:hypothetical protein